MLSSLTGTIRLGTRSLQATGRLLPASVMSWFAGLYAEVVCSKTLYPRGLPLCSLGRLHAGRCDVVVAKRASGQEVTTERAWDEDKAAVLQ